MTDELSDAIAALPREQHDPTLYGIRATFRLEVDGVGVYRIRIDDGVLDVLDGPGDADAILYGSAEAMRDVLFGRQNLLTAVLQGRIDLGGDVAKIFTFHQFLKIRQQHRPAETGDKRVSP
jgi:hypothetical protein